MIPKCTQNCTRKSITNRRERSKAKSQKLASRLDGNTIFKVLGYAKTIKNHSWGGLEGSRRGSGGHVGPKREKVRKNTTCLYALGPLKKSEKSICRRLRGIFLNLHLIFGVFFIDFFGNGFLKRLQHRKNTFFEMPNHQKSTTVQCF